MCYVSTKIFKPNLQIRVTITYSKYHYHLLLLTQSYGSGRTDKGDLCWSIITLLNCFLAHRPIYSHRLNHIDHLILKTFKVLDRII